MPYESFPPPYPPVNGELVDKIVSRLKSQGIFDQFRKECLADVDTKPAYQNLQQRVNGTVATFLATQTWQQNMNKTQLRETLRRHMQQGFLEMGVDRIVEQVVNPKIVPVFMPKVEDLVYDCLGVEKPNKPMHLNPAYISFSVPPPILNKQTNNVAPKSSIVDMLPKDLDPVSPESDYLSANNDTPVKDERNNNNESTPKYEQHDSQLSGISELSSHLGNNSVHENTTNSVSMKSITSPKPNSTDLQFDNFSNLTEKIKQAEISHCHLSSSSQPEISVDRIETEKIPVPNNTYMLPTDEVKIESANDDTNKLDAISNNSMSTFEDSKTFITNKLIKEETCSRTIMSEDSVPFSFSNDKILYSSIKDESVNSNYAEKDKKHEFSVNKDSKEGFPEEVIKLKQESKIIGDIKDISKSDNKDKKIRESSSSSKTSRTSDHRHKVLDSKHRSSHHKKEKDSREHSKSSKEKYSKDDKEKYSKDDKEKHSKDDKEKYSKDDKEKYSKDDKDKCSKDDKEKYSKDEKEKFFKGDKEKYSKDDKEKYSKDDKEKYSKDDKEKYSKDNKEKYSKDNKEKYSKDDKDKSRNKDDKHGTPKDKHKEKGKIDDKSKDGDKKERTELPKENAEKEKKQDRDKSSSRHDKDREKSSRSKNECDKEKHDKDRQDKDKDRKERHEKEKNKQEKDKDKSESNDDKSKDAKKLEKSTHVSSIKKMEKHEDKEKYSKSNDSSRHKHGSDKSKGDEKKDRKRKHERCNDDRKTKEARRSSDRDSNGGKGGNNYHLNNENRSGTTYKSTNTNSEERKKTSKTEGPSDQLEAENSIDGPSSIEIIITKLNSSIEASENEDAQLQREHISPEIPIKKPKIAKNIFEIRKVMQARKTIDRKYKQELSKMNKDCTELTRSEESPVIETSTKDIDSKIPEENKENIKSHGLENVKHMKNKSKKFYGFQQADIDKSYNNMTNFDACIEKLESIYKSLMDLKGQNTEELLDNNLNNLRTKIRSFEEFKDVINSEAEGKLSENAGNGYVLKNINKYPKRGVKREKVSSDVESSEPEPSRKKLKTKRTKESGVVKEKRTLEDTQVFLKNESSKTNEDVDKPIDPINLNTNKDSKRGEVQRTPEYSYEPLAHESVSPYLMTEAMLDILMKESNILPDEDVYPASDESNSDYECSRKKDLPLRLSSNKTVSKDDTESHCQEPTTDKQNVNALTPPNLVICREETGKQQDGSADKLTQQKKRLSRSSQRYESTDLYKPRPVLPQNSKRVRTSRSALSGSTPIQKKDQSDSLRRKKGR